MKNLPGKISNEIYEIQKKMVSIEKQIFELNEERKKLQEKKELKKIAIQDAALQAYKEGKFKTLKEAEHHSRKGIKANIMPLEKKIENIEKQIFELETTKQLMKIEVEKLQRDFQIAISNSPLFIKN